MNARLERLRLQIVASESAALIGARIRGAREDRGWSRRELAKRMDGLATDNDIYRWEKGQHRPRDDALAAAARALELPLSYFFQDQARGPTPDLSNGSDHATPETNAALIAQLDARLSSIEDLLAAVKIETEAMKIETEARDKEVLRLLGGGMPPDAGSQPPPQR